MNTTGVECMCLPYKSLTQKKSAVGVKLFDSFPHTNQVFSKLYKFSSVIYLILVHQATLTTKLLSASYGIFISFSLVQFVVLKEMLEQLCQAATGLWLRRSSGPSSTHNIGGSTPASSSLHVEVSFGEIMIPSDSVCF